jgi:hypothetical protein
MSEGIYHNRLSKFTAGQKPNPNPNRTKVSDIVAAAKASITKLCNCPKREPGKVSSDIDAHLPGCHIRKRLQSGQYTINTSAIPHRISSWYGLGIVLGEENF